MPSPYYGIHRPTPRGRATLYAAGVSQLLVLWYDAATGRRIRNLAGPLRLAPPHLQTEADVLAASVSRAAPLSPAAGCRDCRCLLLHDAAAQRPVGMCRFVPLPCTPLQS
jgi:hypothetical protein